MIVKHQEHAVPLSETLEAGQKVEVVTKGFVGSTEEVQAPSTSQRADPGAAAIRTRRERREIEIATELDARAAQIGATVVLGGFG